jgi:hypothetical protein
MVPFRDTQERLMLSCCLLARKLIGMGGALLPRRASQPCSPPGVVLQAGFKAW